jgi:hypothetical protein
MRGYGYHDDDRFAASVSFEQFVADPRSNGPNAVCGEKWKQSGDVYRWWYCCGGKKPDNVHIIRVEDLPEGLHDALGCGNGVPLDWVNSYEHAPWKDWYNVESAAAVRNKFGWTIGEYYPELTDFHGEGTMTAAERGAQSPLFA